MLNIEFQEPCLNTFLCLDPVDLLVHFVLLCVWFGSETCEKEKFRDSKLLKSYQL